MTFLVKGKQKKRARFIKRATSAHGNSWQSQLGSQSTNLALDGILRDTLLSSLVNNTASMTPRLFTTLPPIRDLLHTGTSQVQDATIQECLPFLSGVKSDVPCNKHGVPRLDRQRHIRFLHKTLQNLPAPYVAADASRPWMFYWALTGLVALGEDVSEYRERLISTVQPIQNATGGFGGGNGQMSHLAPTYAILLSLIVVGGEEALDVIDRKAMWKWLSALKQPDGGFQLCLGGEEDVR